jgi:hypothetical protein
MTDPGEDNSFYDFSTDFTNFTGSSIRDKANNLSYQDKAEQLKDEIEAQENHEFICLKLDSQRINYIDRG